ncbi:MAG: hypothetical protein ACFE7R_07330, partial [Candidatus Hodarchaeota archaeon]
CYLCLEEWAHKLKYLEDEKWYDAWKEGLKVLKLKTPSRDASEITSWADKSKARIPLKTEELAIHVPGGIGIEPILYLFSSSAEKVAEVSIGIAASL